MFDDSIVAKEPKRYHRTRFAFAQQDVTLHLITALLGNYSISKSFFAAKGRERSKIARGKGRSDPVAACLFGIEKTEGRAAGPAFCFAERCGNLRRELTG